MPVFSNGCVFQPAQPVQPQNSQLEEAVLAESFLLSVKNAAKPGIQIDGA
jgi:hypothetical protein